MAPGFLNEMSTPAETAYLKVLLYTRNALLLHIKPTIISDSILLLFMIWLSIWHTRAHQSEYNPVTTLPTWWRHQMKTFSLCAGKSRVAVEVPSQRPVTRALMFSLICAWTNGRANRRADGDLRRHRTHYDVTAMIYPAVPNFDGCTVAHLNCNTGKIPWGPYC